MKKARLDARRKRPTATLEEEILTAEMSGEDSPEEEAYDEALLPKPDLDLSSGGLSPEAGTEGSASLEGAADDEFFFAHGRSRGRSSVKKKRSRK